MNKLQEHILSNWSELKSTDLFVACSGGLDSMVLLHLLSSLNFNPKVLHMNYQLRGKESDGDADFVENYCRKNGIEFEKKTVVVPKNTNLQEAARNLRYDWFESKTSSNTKIALAHHFDDQIETFFLNLARKSGILGMACIPEKRDQFVRPLLNFSKSDLKEYAVSVGLTWREDSSNKSNKYRRNRLRNELIPEMRKSVPELDESVRKLISVFQQNQLALESKINPIYSEFLKSKKLPFSTFDKLTSEEKFELFRRLNLSSPQLEELNQLRKSEKGKKLEINHSKFNSIVVEQDRFTLEERNRIKFNLIIEKVDQLPSTFDLDSIYLDSAKIHGELSLRNWQIGDKIDPIGMKGSQLISDIIKDAKLDINAKNNCLVLHDDKHILWCPGLKVSRHAFANTSTSEILHCSISRITP